MSDPSLSISSQGDAFFDALPADPQPRAPYPAEADSVTAAADAVLPVPERVAVVVPVHNRPTLVRRALASIAGQSLRPATVIVVDDGSTDDTADSAREWLQHNADFAWRVVTTRNGGPAAARNAGFDLVWRDHDLVAFLDSDDEWPDDFLAAGAAALDGDPVAVGAVADRQTIRDGAPFAYDVMSAFTADPVLFVLEFGGGLVQCCLFRTAAVRKAGGFEARWRTGEDARLLFDMVPLGPFVHSAGAAVRIHQRSPATDTREASSISLASMRDHWIWSDQMDRLIAALPPQLRHARYAAICRVMAVRWTYTRRHLRDGGFWFLSLRARWRRMIWQRRDRRAARRATGQA
jgi:glycosyltransferase involved in cell wall biosynthesis